MTSEGQQISVLEEILGEKQLHPNIGGLWWADSNGGLYKDLLNTSLVENNRFKVYGDNCDFFWTVFGKRFDVTVEPDKNSVDVKGDGPYLYI